MRKINSGVILAGAFLIGLLILIGYLAIPTSDENLRLLAWVGYEEEDFIHRFEEEFGINVSVKTYVGGDQMYSIFTQEPNGYDVVVMDPEYIVKLQREGLLRELDPSLADTNNYFQAFREFPPTTIDGGLYGVVVRFGSCGLVFNTKFISAGEAESYEVLFDPRLKGRVGIWDWYLPSMGCVARSLGYTQPYSIGDDGIQRVQSRLRRLRGQVAAIYSTPAAITQGLRNEDVWIVPAVGEWIAVGLAEEGLPVAWSLPREGGIMWIEALGIPSGAKNLNAAASFIRWAQRPTVQAALMKRRAYQSQAPCPLSYNSLAPDERSLRKAESEEAVERLLSRLSVRELPTSPSEDVWQEIWEGFKAYQE